MCTKVTKAHLTWAPWPWERHLVAGISFDIVFNIISAARNMASQSKSRARMQIQGQNTQIHKVRPNAASVSHRDEQESITIIKMNSKWSYFSFLSLVFISNRWFSLVFIKLTMKNQRKPSLVMMRECPCSTKTREVLENPSSPPSRFPFPMGFAPLEPISSSISTLVGDKRVTQ